MHCASVGNMGTAKAHVMKRGLGIPLHRELFAEWLVHGNKELLQTHVPAL